MIKAIVFDLDGTLLNTLDGIKSAVNQVLHKYNLPEFDNTFYKNAVGSGIEKLIQDSFPTDLHSQLPTLIDEVKQNYSMSWETGSSVYDGIHEVLDTITAMHIPMAVLSNKPIRYTKISVDRFFPRINFDPVLGGRDGYPLKPDPYGLNFISHALHVSCKEILMIGDSAIDIETARNAGAKSMGVLWGFKGRMELEEAGPDKIAVFPKDIVRMIGDCNEA